MAAAWWYAAGAIGCEVVATLSLRASNGFTRPVFDVIVVAGYLASFYLLGRSLAHLSVGQVYAVWSAVGTTVVALAGFVLFGDRVGWLGIAGIALVIVGVTLLVLSPGAVRGG
ncbi:MAG: DMT family transporter [Jatrophihabitans sp.]|uniref:DMT family transporter n=1 Tax=Jatrophihabitans sp. TaxID=1932789 RepID=UPI003F7DFEF8